MSPAERCKLGPWVPQGKEEGVAEVGRRNGCSKAYFSTWRWPCQASASVLRTAGTYTAARSGDLKVSHCARFILFTRKSRSRVAMSLVV